MAGQGGIGQLGVVEVGPLIHDPFGLEAVRELVQVDCLVLYRAPQALDEDVVHAAAPAIHGDGHIRVLEHAGAVVAGELVGTNAADANMARVYSEEIALGIKIKPRRKRAVRDAGRLDCAIEKGSSFPPKPVRITSVAFLSALL